MTYIINSNAIILFLNDNKTLRIEKTERIYPNIIKTFALPREEQEDAILCLLNSQLNATEVVKNTSGFELINDEDGAVGISYKGDRLPLALEQKVLSIVKEGLPLDHFQKFWENLEENPSASSISELVQFLEYKELPITDDGYFLAYKGVSSDYFSHTGNKTTKVVKGVVDGSGRILNNIGAILEVRRGSVDDNRDHGCSFGLHAGSLDYARGFAGSDGRIVILKINPKDVVSVPSDCSFQKCRVCKYEVIAEYEQEILSPVVDSNGEETLMTNDVKERSEFVEKIANYLGKKTENGYSEITVRQIQNIFREYPSKESVLDALQELWYFWYINADGIYVVEL